MMHVGLNLEFARTEQLSLQQALHEAAALGYRFVEPYVYTPVSLEINSHLALRTESPYHHVDAASADLAGLDRLRRELGLTFSALDAHASLLLPQVGVPYLRRAIEVAAELDCPVVVSDEGPLAEEWMTLDRAFDVLCMSLEAVLPHARARGVRYAMELHNALTARPDRLARLLTRFGPDDVGVNFDTGNAFLAGNEPVEYLGQVAGRVVHVHVKDIPRWQLPLRGKVTGTRVGVAAGDGLIDLPAVVAVLARAGYDGVLSIECDTLEQGQKSLPHMTALITAAGRDNSG